MNQLFLKDLADKTRRGLRGRVEAGKSGGGNSYGYDVVRRTLDRRHSGDRRARASTPTRRPWSCAIFEDYASGRSPEVDRARLNREGVPGPRGGQWSASTIHGNPTRGTGILNNELYVGRLVWNRLRYVKDPATGKRVSRPNPADAWIVKDVPDLRIVAGRSGTQVKSRQERAALPRGANRGKALSAANRPRYLLSGLTPAGLAAAACR